MGNINFDKSSLGTITGQGIGLKVSNNSDQSMEDFGLVALWGNCQFGVGLKGESSSAKYEAVNGTNGGGGTGVRGESRSGRGVWGISESFIATVGDSTSGTGVWGHSITGPGVVGIGKPAGRFEGDVVVTGDITVGGADCAEDFDLAIADAVQPGTVMVIDEGGGVRQSGEAYDKKVAGVASGAGDLRPGLVLDKQQNSNGARITIGLVGRVFCKVDARYAPIEVGDLLTTSDTPGHAMKASDPRRAFGAVIGKSLRSLPEGRGLIPILIALQ